MRAIAGGGSRNPAPLHCSAFHVLSEFVLSRTCYRFRSCDVVAYLTFVGLRILSS